MPVYPVAAGFATLCASPGCWCRDRRPCYPSDRTDEQWAVMEPQAREVVAQLTVAVGRPMVHDLRSMCDAVSYVVKNGVEWRALPVHVTDREAVYAFARLGELERHLGDGVIEAIVDAALGKGRLRRRQRRRIMSYPLGHSHTRAPPPLSPKQTRRQEQNTGASTSRHATTP